jgi:glycosyltransferase involved in cell wall biosynthesis
VSEAILVDRPLEVHPRLREFSVSDPTTAPATSAAVSVPRVRSTKFGGVSIIIPCYNEQEMIASTVRRAAQTVQRTQRPYEILIVDDGSTDGTAVKLRAMAGEPGLRVLRNERNQGYGFSLKRAIAEAQYELIVITDADGTYPINRISELIERMDGADMVVGARTGSDVHVPLLRRPAKWALQKLAGYLAATPIPDLNSGLRVMKRALVRRFLPMLPDGFSFTTTITLALLTHGYQVRFVPIDYAKRVGRSSIRPLRDTLNFLGLIVRTVLYFRPLKIFVPVSVSVFALAVAVALVTKLVFGQLADVVSVSLVIASVQLLAIGLLADLIDKRSPSPG